MNKSPENLINQAVNVLGSHDRGRNALRNILKFFQDGGAGLDSLSNEAVKTILYFGGTTHPGSVIDAISDKIDGTE